MRRRALHPYSAGGAYVNFMMDEGQARVKATYGPNHGRLGRVKAAYDPDNVFRVNQNILPRGLRIRGAVRGVRPRNRGGARRLTGLASAFAPFCSPHLAKRGARLKPRPLRVHTRSCRLVQAVSRSP